MGGKFRIKILLVILLKLCGHINAPAYFYLARFY